MSVVCVTKAMRVKRVVTNSSVRDNFRVPCIRLFRSVNVTSVVSVLDVVATKDVIGVMSVMGVRSIISVTHVMRVEGVVRVSGAIVNVTIVKTWSYPCYDC